MREHIGVDEHSHRHEEHCAEKVLYRVDEPFDCVGFHGFRKYAAHHESAESGAVTQLDRQHNHCEAHSHRYYKKCFLAYPFAVFAQQQRNDEHAHKEQQRKIEEQLQQAVDYGNALEFLAHGYC